MQKSLLWMMEARMEPVKKLRPWRECVLCPLQNLGQSAALFAGLQAATGELIAMMDGDGRMIR
jgi:glycosyltransferase involved in cell wall biosynthesis